MLTKRCFRLILTIRSKNIGFKPPQWFRKRVLFFLHVAASRTMGRRNKCSDLWFQKRVRFFMPCLTERLGCRLNVVTSMGVETVRFCRGVGCVYACMCLSMRACHGSDKNYAPSLIDLFSTRSKTRTSKHHRFRMSWVGGWE